MILAIKESFRIQLIIVNDTNNMIDDEYKGCAYIARADKLVIHTDNILKMTRKREMKVNNK